MELFRAETFEADTLAHLPDQATLRAKTRAMAENLEALRAAPVTEPFNGPAILSGRASAVFFHEVLGHRLEGQRQRGDDEGQTFTKLLGKPILPTFLSVADDPTLRTFDGHPLSEWTPAERTRMGLGRSFQQGGLWPSETAHANLLTTRTWLARQASQALPPQTTHPSDTNMHHTTICSTCHGRRAGQSRR